MKTQATIILIISLFIAPGIAMSQSTGTSKSKELREKELEKYFEARKLYDLDSIIAPSMRIAGKALSGSAWSTSSDNYFQLLDNSKNSTLSFRKEFDEKKNIERSYEMEFDKEQKSLEIRIAAEAREGRIKITINKPNGKEFKSLEIDGEESLNWNQTINAYTDENKKDFAGTWVVKVSTSAAVGYYNVKLTVR
ncbi:MAG: hypothetical protein CVU00_15085 [Bacteroidetes bacterium HGW-Bacteroidetes-17]|jgi:hypothetical protein|nr:MAG: hypothetical protein CVU00_15085 [Bacteroidetes bacterium HGW-Bacteroidetes-17]